MPDDIIITCSHCQSQFVWTQEEQSFYTAKGLQAPIHCAICRSLLKTAARDNFRGNSTIDSGSSNK